jgi:phosphoribosylcarboxyaminoimidazole (NCAIR) mutase
LASLGFCFDLDFFLLDADEEDADVDVYVASAGGAFFLSHFVCVFAVTPVTMR